MILPGREALESHVDFLHATCNMVPGLKNITGAVLMKQNFWGEGPVTMKFQLQGLPRNYALSSVRVHRYGDVSEKCTKIGTTSTLPQDAWWSHNYPEDPTSDSDNEFIVHAFEQTFNTTQGHLNGEFVSDGTGKIYIEKAFDTVTLAGMQSIYSKSLVIHGSHTNEDGLVVSGALGCCVIGDASGADFNDPIRPWTLEDFQELYGDD